MPITKQDVAKFGQGLKDTLNVISQQIQYGKDISHLEKVQKNLSNMKDITTNPDGTPKSQQDIARALFNIQSDIQTNIKTPVVESLALNTVGNFFKSTLAGHVTEEQNKFAIQRDKAIYPSSIGAINEATEGRDLSSIKYSFPLNPTKYFAPKVVITQHVNEDGSLSKDYYDEWLTGIRTDGGQYKYFLGVKSVTELTAQEKLNEAELARENAQKVAKMNQLNINVNKDLNTRLTELIDPSGNHHLYKVNSNGQLSNLDGTQIPSEELRKISTYKTVTGQQEFSKEELSKTNQVDAVEDVLKSVKDFFNTKAYSGYYEDITTALGQRKPLNEVQEMESFKALPYDLQQKLLKAYKYY